MSSKMTTNLQLSTTEPKKQKQKEKQTKQTTRTGTESQKWGSQGGYQQGGEGVEWGEKLQGIRGIHSRYKIHRGRFRIVQEMEKPKNLYVRPMDMNQVQGNAGARGSAGQRGERGEKKSENSNSIINKIYLKIDMWPSFFASFLSFG